MNWLIISTFRSICSVRYFAACRPSVNVNSIRLRHFCGSWLAIAYKWLVYVLGLSCPERNLISNICSENKLQLKMVEFQNKTNLTSLCGERWIEIQVFLCLMFVYSTSSILLVWSTNFRSCVSCWNWHARALMYMKNLTAKKNLSGKIESQQQ